MSPFAILNGRLVAPAELTLSFADAGFVFAATVTDFCRTYRHQLFRWPDHLARLRRDCETIQVPLPYTDAELTRMAEELVKHNSAMMDSSDDLALITFATPGPLAYMAAGGENHTLGMHTFPLPRERYRRFFAEGVALAWAGEHPGGLVPANVKHRNRLHWWLADRKVRDIGAVALLTDAGGFAADTALGAVFAVVDGEVIRPIRGTVLDSIMAGVVGELCGQLGIPVREEPLNYRSLPANVSEVFLAGSGFGIAGVRQVNERSLTWPGLVYRQLLEAWSALVGVDVERQFLG